MVCPCGICCPWVRGGWGLDLSVIRLGASDTPSRSSDGWGYYELQYSFTACHQSPTLYMMSTEPATTFEASICSILAHSFRGRPILLMYWSVAGCSVPGVKVISRKASPPLSLRILPYSISCCLSKCQPRGIWHANSNTFAFDTRE